MNLLNSKQPVPSKKLTTLLVFILTISFYIYTLSPSLAWGDGVRLQSEVISGESFILSEMTEKEFSSDPFPFSKVGITAWDHPLYIVMGHTLVNAFPAVHSIWLVNLISAVFGAASIALVFLISHQFTSSFVASIYAASSLAVSHTFWWHSSTPEVYTLFAFLLLSGLYFFNRFEKTDRLSALTYSAFFFGLAGTNHILAFLAAPALIIYLLFSKKHWRYQIPDLRKLILPILAFFVGFSLFIIQFIRMTRSFAIDEIMGPVVGSTFLNGLGAFSLLLIAESLFTYLLFLFVQFGIPGIILGAVGIRKIFTHTNSSLRKIFWLYVVYTIFGIFYRVTDQFAFFLTAHVFFALLMGVGLSHILPTLHKRMRFILILVLLLSILTAPLFYSSIPHFAQNSGIDDSVLKIPQIGTGLRDGLAYYINPNKRGDFDAYDFGSETISNLAPNSIVIAEWYTDTDEYFILRHFHKVLGVRPDVSIMGFPLDDPFSFDSNLVLSTIEESFPVRPVYLASLSEQFYASSDLIKKYCILPENNMYRLYLREKNKSQCLGIDSVTE